MNDNSNAIEVEHLFKSFRISHESNSTLFDHLLSFANSTRKYERLKVLDDISFNVRKGEMLGVIGKNGGGKTTLLRVLSGIIKQDNGTIRRQGSVIPFIEVGSGFSPDLTAVENVILYGMLLGFSKVEMKQKLPEILRYSELEKFADTKLKNFSSGMHARLAFSTAMQVNPDIMLVDEILSVGDTFFQEKSFHTFLTFKRAGKTIIFVSHNLDQIRRLCDRAMLLHEGKIRKIGHPIDVIHEFRNITAPTAEL